MGMEPAFQGRLDEFGRNFNKKMSKFDRHGKDASMKRAALLKQAGRDYSETSAIGDAVAKDLQHRLPIDAVGQQALAGTDGSLDDVAKLERETAAKNSEVRGGMNDYVAQSRLSADGDLSSTTLRAAGESAAALERGAAAKAGVERDEAQEGAAADSKFKGLRKQQGGVAHGSD